MGLYTIYVLKKHILCKFFFEACHIDFFFVIEQSSEVWTLSHLRFLVTSLGLFHRYITL